MLYKDDERVHLNDSKSNVAEKCRAYLEELRAVATKRGIVRFKTLPGMKNPGLFIPTQATVKTPYGAYVIRYATGVQKKGDQLVYTPSTLRWPASGSLDLNRDPELALFMFGFSTLCLNGKNPNKSATCWFMLENPEQEAQVKISSKKLIGKVTTLVLDTIDEGGAPLQLVMNYAKSKGLRFNGDDNEKVVRARTFEMIEIKDLYDEFMQSLTDRKYFEYSNMLDKAVEYNVLQLMRLSRTDDHKAWRLINEDGTPGDIVCKVPIRSNARAYMLEELENNTYLAQQIRETLDEILDDDDQISSEIKPSKKDFAVQPVPEKQVTSKETQEAEDELDMLMKKSEEEVNGNDLAPKLPDPPQGPGDCEGSPPSGPKGNRVVTGSTGINTPTGGAKSGPAGKNTGPAKGTGKGTGKGRGRGGSKK